jgi:hypothetical protein
MSALDNRPEARVASSSISTHQNTDGLAIASLVLGWLSFLTVLTAIPAIICGYTALRRIRKSGRPGARKALIGLRLGWITVVVAILGLIALVVVGRLISKSAQPLSQTTVVTQPTAVPAPAPINKVVPLPPVDTSSNTAIFLRVMTIHHEAMCTGNTWLLQQAWGTSPQPANALDADSFQMDTTALNKYGKDCLVFDDPTTIQVTSANLFSDQVHMLVTYSATGAGKFVANLALTDGTWNLTHLASASAE